MPANTPFFAFPYPLNTDPVVNGDDTIKALAEKVEAQLSGGGVTVTNPLRMTANSSSITNPASNSGQSVAVTWPVGRFTVAPLVVVTGISSGYSAASAGGVTVTGFTAKMWNPTGSTPTGSVMVWIAVQMTPTTGPGLLALPDPAANTTVICHTSGCENAGQAIDLHVLPETTDVVCGVCTQPITDVVVLA
jgi:hypothetical protein